MNGPRIRAIWEREPDYAGNDDREMSIDVIEHEPCDMCGKSDDDPLALIDCAAHGHPSRAMCLCAGCLSRVAEQVRRGF